MPEPAASPPVPPPRAAVRVPTPALSAYARTIVHQHAALCVAATFVPNPVANSLAVTGVQLKMLADLSHAYGVPFSQDISRSLIGATAGGVLNYFIARNPITRGVRDFLTATVPWLAWPLRLLAGPALMAVYTIVLGYAFVRHYESGGAYHDFNWRDFRHELTRKLGLPPPRLDPPIDVVATSVAPEKV